MERSDEAAATDWRVEPRTGLCDVHAVFDAAQVDLLRRLAETSLADVVRGA